MIISELKLYNFRKFKSENNDPGLEITFHSGLNAIVGENDSGKTAVIDAIKLVLLTQSNEYIRPVEEDFYQDENGNSSNEFQIYCKITNFTKNEAKNFIEYLKTTRVGEDTEYELNLQYRAWREGHKIYSDLRVCDFEDGIIEDGIIMDGKARELLKTVYLRPLRDAKREMSSGRSSRISQILMSHSSFKDKEKHKILEIFKEANMSIDKYFTEDKEGKIILEVIRQNLELFHGQNQSSMAELKTSDIKLKSILESLSLSAPEINPGLGELNLLFIAAELLLLKNDTNGGMKLALIEEIEAHLHPQAQLRLITYLQKEYNEKDIQIIISTHSPILASKINLKNIILMKNGSGYDLSEGKTKLSKSDYLFLQRFLDSTKSNLFFAKGIIMVEGDAENILVPVIAQIIDYPLEKFGISIVNVRSTAFLRYSKIFLREDNTDVGVPVSIITDCDVLPLEDDSNKKFKDRNFKEKGEESKKAVKEKEKKYSEGSVKGFISKRWTLEYCLAASTISEEFHMSINFGKKMYNTSSSTSLNRQKVEKSLDEYKKEKEKFSSYCNEEKAFEIYKLMLDSNGTSKLKSIVAQCLAAYLRWEILSDDQNIEQEDMFDLDLYSLKIDENKKNELKSRIENDDYLKYIVDAIKYAAGVDLN